MLSVYSFAGTFSSFALTPNSFSGLISRWWFGGFACTLTSLPIAPAICCTVLIGLHAGPTPLYRLSQAAVTRGAPVHSQQLVAAETSDIPNPALSIWHLLIFQIAPMYLEYTLPLQPDKP